MSKDFIKFVVSIKKNSEKEQKSLLIVDANSNEEDSAAALSVPLNLYFNSAGEYEIIFSMPEHTTFAAIPFEVRLLRLAELYGRRTEILFNKSKGN